MKSKILIELKLLEEFGKDLKEPHTKCLKDENGIFELRIKSKNNISKI